MILPLVSPTVIICRTNITFTAPTLPHQHYIYRTNTTALTLHLPHQHYRTNIPLHHLLQVVKNDRSWIDEYKCLPFRGCTICVTGLDVGQRSEK